MNDEMKYFGPAENWFWVLRCDEEGRKPDVWRVLMWVTVNGKIIGMVNNVLKPGEIMEPVFMGTYKHLDDLAPDEREILAETTRVPVRDVDQIYAGAWLSYLRFEVINDRDNSIAEFQKLAEAEDHFHDETQIAQKLGKSGVPIKLVAVIRTGNPGMMELVEANET